MICVLCSVGNVRQAPLLELAIIMTSIMQSGSYGQRFGQGWCPSPGFDPGGPEQHAGLAYHIHHTI